MAVAFGAIAGATARWGLTESFADAGAWPWATFVANVVGSFLLGAIVGRWGAPPSASMHIGLSVGFCGALTTMSAFAVDVAAFMRTDRWALAAAYLVGSVASGVVGFVAARSVGRQRG